jgi:nucleotide-binding universal stress UspA family protein
MPTATIRRVLAATELGPHSDAVVRSAAALAALSGAELHLVHAIELPDPLLLPALGAGVLEIAAGAEHELQEQVERAVPVTLSIASGQARYGAPYRVILERADEISADLIVLGPHRGDGFAARFLGTTAERVLAGAQALCLVVREPLRLPLTRVAAPVDFSDGAAVALATAARWARAFVSGGERPAALRSVYVAWPATAPAERALARHELQPALERQLRHADESRAEPGLEDASVEILWESDPAEAVTAWAEDQRADLLVLATHGRTGLRRALLGSVAAAITRRASLPVLLVPPALAEARRPWPPSLPRLRRVVVGTDFGPAADVAVEYALGNLASPDDTLLVHCLELRRPPAFLRARYPAEPTGERDALLRAHERLAEHRARLGHPELRLAVRSEPAADGLTQAALEGAADLIVVGGTQTGRGGWGTLGSTAEGVVRIARVPVLIARDPLMQRPHEILVGVSETGGDGVLPWARLLADRSDARLTVFHSVQTSGAAEGRGPAETDPLVLARAAEWLTSEVERCGAAAESTRVRVAAGEPAAAILSAIRRFGSDLVVVGQGVERVAAGGLIGNVATCVLRQAPCPVLVVSQPVRARHVGPGSIAHQRTIVAELVR